MNSKNAMENEKMLTELLESDTGLFNENNCRLKKAPLFLSVPIDCLGEIIAYFDKILDVVNLMSICKEVKKDFQSPHFYGYSRAVFVVGIGMKPVEGVFANFVRRIRIEESFIKDEVAKKFFRMFPKLEDVDINLSRFISDETIQELQNVKLLDVSSCLSININWLGSYKYLTNLTMSGRNLKSFKLVKELINVKTLNLSHNPRKCFDNPHVTKDLMSYFPNLVEFHGKECHIGKGEVFMHQKKLQYLDLTDCNSRVAYDCDVTDEHIKNLVNLETLIINQILCTKSWGYGETIYSGDLSIEAFKNLSNLRRLEIIGNDRLDPIILSFLPKLRILSVESCTEEMIREALKICHRFEKFKVCECLPHKPPVNPNNHYNVEEGTCKNCSQCELCRKDGVVIGYNICDECNRTFCFDNCTSESECEICLKNFCIRCKPIQYVFEVKCGCSDDWDLLCSDCSGDYFSCDNCENTICNVCADYCRECKKKVCRRCQASYWCDLCEKDIEKAKHICKDCFDPIRCECAESCGSNRQLCEECVSVCKCGLVVCEECLTDCSLCKKVGCNVCVDHHCECGELFCNHCQEKMKFLICKKGEGGCGGIFGCGLCIREEEIEKEGKKCGYCIQNK